MLSLSVDSLTLQTVPSQIHLAQKNGFLRMVRLRLLALALTTFFTSTSYANHEHAPNGQATSSFFIHTPRNDTEHTLNALFATINPGEDLWDRIRDGFSMPNLDMVEVAAQERYYSKHPEYINRIVNRSSRYLYHVVSEVQRRGMPMEIALLPIVESAYNPKAESHAKASGMWQFIPSTGKMYGLERTWWYDGRRDVVAATDAALNYLQRLYDIFGDWPLALAAYNWGDGSVKRAQAKNLARGQSTEYTAINMPNETRNYVPKLLAIRNIIANPIAFGIQLASVPDKPYFTTLAPTRHMDIEVAAHLAEIALEELLHLNPGYIRPVIAHKENRKLVLPIDKVEAFKKNLAKYDKPLLSWRPYTTKRGESFQNIAGQHGISLEILRNVNSLNNRESKARGQTILTPIKHQLTASEQKTIATIVAHREGTPIIKSMPEVAQDKQVYPKINILESAVPPNTLATKPHAEDFRLLKNTATHVDHPIKSKSINNTKVIRYQVKKGETLYRVAKNFTISVEELKDVNRIKDNHVQSGQVLIIPASHSQPQ